MKMFQKAYKLGAREYYLQHLTLVNAILNLELTKKELEVLAAFMSLDKSLTQDDMFNTVARKKVRESVGKGLSPGGLGNYLIAFVEKKVVLKNPITKKLTLRENLFPDEKVQGYQIKLVKEG